LPSVVVGITGSIAAYKSVDLVRRLGEAGFEVTVVMTESATRFVQPLTFQAVTRRPVGTNLWDDPFIHIDQARTDLFLVAPATANILAKAASGLADDLVSTLLLSFGDRVSFAPAMNWRMYAAEAVRENLRILKERGCGVVDPEEGDLACGEEGPGRLASTAEMLAHVERRTGDGSLSGRKVLVTLGPTREPLDPVRYLSNRSSGKMGVALALEAYSRGADVVAVTGPTDLFLPRGIDRVRVETAAQMRKEVLSRIQGVNLAFMVAAVADYSPRDPASEKRTKTGRSETLELEPTTDILREVGRLQKRPFLVGFSAETGPKKERALEKMKEKAADLMVFNDVTAPGAGFETKTNIVSLVEPGGSITDLPRMLKRDVARRILDRVTDRTG